MELPWQFSWRQLATGSNDPNEQLRIYFLAFVKISRIEPFCDASRAQHQAHLMDAILEVITQHAPVLHSHMLRASILCATMMGQELDPQTKAWIIQSERDASQLEEKEIKRFSTQYCGDGRYMSNAIAFANLLVQMDRLETAYKFVQHDIIEYDSDRRGAHSSICFDAKEDLMKGTLVMECPGRKNDVPFFVAGRTALEERLMVLGCRIHDDSILVHSRLYPSRAEQCAGTMKLIEARHHVLLPSPDCDDKLSVEYHLVLGLTSILHKWSSTNDVAVQKRLELIQIDTLFTYNYQKSVSSFLDQCGAGVGGYSAFDVTLLVFMVGFIALPREAFLHSIDSSESVTVMTHTVANIPCQYTNGKVIPHILNIAYAHFGPMLRASKMIRAYKSLDFKLLIRELSLLLPIWNMLTTRIQPNALNTIAEQIMLHAMTESVRCSHLLTINESDVNELIGPSSPELMNYDYELLVNALPDTYEPLVRHDGSVVFKALHGTTLGNPIQRMAEQERLGSEIQLMIANTSNARRA